VGRVRRTVWDGARELWEIQMPAAVYDTTRIENDTATVTSWAGPNYAGTYSDPNPPFELPPILWTPGLTDLC